MKWGTLIGWTVAEEANDIPFKAHIVLKEGSDLQSSL